MDILNPSMAETDFRALFLVSLFLPFLLMGLAIIWNERRRAGFVRRFRCREAGREVEVLFVDNEVRGCTAFHPAEAVTCRRQCQSGAYRRQWEPALPVFSRRTRGSSAA